MDTERLDEALKRIRHATRALPKTQDRPIARRNARKRVLAAVRAFRAVLDESFPAIIVKGKVVRLKTFEGRLARLKKAGWTMVDNGYIAGYALAGVRVKRVYHKDPGERGQSYIGYFIPAWAWAIAKGMPEVHQAELRAAKKSNKLKRAAQAAAFLSA